MSEEMKEVKWDEVKPATKVLNAVKEAVNKLVGMTVETAQKWLDDHGIDYRIRGTDKVDDTQYREDRVNLTVEDDKITDAEVG